MRIRTSYLRVSEHVKTCTRRAGLAFASPPNLKAPIATNPDRYAVANDEDVRDRRREGVRRTLLADLAAHDGGQAGGGGRGGEACRDYHGAAPAVLT